MRKTNKKLKKLAADKYGVILVTVIFIVAMALVFITTALTISIATRQRVYTNAKYQQARLTVTSLAQSVWQAIYSQQISDRDLVALAKSGAVVSFTNNDVPGMGQGGASATAYFYCYNAGDPSKICIEFKCDIDGATDGACQYYTLVLERHKGEDIPPSAFNIPVNLGKGGTLNRCVFGINASLVGSSNERDQFCRFVADDNIAFIHVSTVSTDVGSGFYTTLITDGPFYSQDSVFAYRAYFLGSNASLDWHSNQSIAAQRGLDGSASPTGANRQYGNLYFWGTSSPFTRNGSPIVGNDVFNLTGINDVYFDYQQDDHGNRTGFEHNDITFQSGHDLGMISGVLHYEDGISINGWRPSPDTWQSHTSGWEPVTDDGIDDYMTVDPELMDTIDEVSAKYGGQLAGATELSNITSLSSGTYVIDGTTTNSYTVTSNLTMNVSGGDIVLFLTNGAHLYFNQNCYIQVSGSGNNKFIVLLCDGSQIHIGNNGSNPVDNSGIVDLNCFSGAYTYNNLDQTTNPRCQIFSMYTGGQPVRVEGNHNGVLTASLGFFPQSSPNETNGGHIYVYNCGNDNPVYYGRISVGGIDNASSGQFVIPYCPQDDSDGPTRTTAYRDNTDFSVVMDECQYFTATP